jgi:NADPH:quinone reductase-like Zn-dependent oxidoreductase
MKALLSKTVGGPETLEMSELPDPVAGPGQLLIAVKACSINYPDVLIIEDKYQFKPPRPFAPGSEVSGVVEAVGEGVTGWAPGDRILATTGSGGLVEKIVIDANRVFRLPEGRSFAEGASLILTYGTTIHALLDRGHLKEGHMLLVLGAAAFSSELTAATTRAPFDKDQSKALAEQFKAAGGKSGYDVIYDPVGGDYAEPALRSIGWEGRYLVVGFPAGIPRLPLNLTLLKSCDVCGVFWGAFAARDPQANQAHIDHLFRLWEAGKIGPTVSETFAFEDGGKAIAKMAARGAIGKLVVNVGE